MSIESNQLLSQWSATLLGDESEWVLNRLRERIAPATLWELSHSLYQHNVAEWGRFQELLRTHAAAWSPSASASPTPSGSPAAPSTPASPEPSPISSPGACAPASHSPTLDEFRLSRKAMDTARQADLDTSAVLEYMGGSCWIGLSGSEFFTPLNSGFFSGRLDKVEEWLHGQLYGCWQSRARKIREVVDQLAALACRIEQGGQDVTDFADTLEKAGNLLEWISDGAFDQDRP